jgi:hypothetical protein
MNSLVSTWCIKWLRIYTLGMELYMASIFGQLHQHKYLFGIPTGTYCCKGIREHYKKYNCSGSKSNLHICLSTQ